MKNILRNLPVFDKKFLVLFFIALFSYDYSYAANSEEIPVIYIHTDRSVYSPGEFIWYSGYIFNSNLQPYLFSKLSYIELTDLNGKFIDIVMAKVENGRFSGQIKIDPELQSGTYYITSYLESTRIFPERAFKLPIKITDTNDEIFSVLNREKDSSEKGEIIDNEEIVVSFLPEGSSLISGTNQRIGIISVSKGKMIPVKIEGSIINSKEEVIKDIYTDENGIGVTEINVPDGQLKFVLKNGTILDFPSQTKKGCALKVDRNNKIITISALGTYSEPIKGLAIKYFDKVYIEVPSAENNIWTLPEDSLREGISVICAIDNSDNIISERLIYKKPVEISKKVRLSLGKDYKSFRESIPFCLLMDDDEGEFSISFTDLSQSPFGENYQPSLPDYVYVFSQLNKLNPNLSGYPGGMGELSEEYIEKLLLTYGWRNIFEKEGNPEIKSADALFLNGQILNSLTKLPLSDAYVVLTFRRGAQSKPTVLQVDKTGRFNVELQNFYNELELQIGVVDKQMKKRDAYIKLENNYQYWNIDQYSLNSIKKLEIKSLGVGELPLLEIKEVSQSNKNRVEKIVKYESVISDEKDLNREKLVFDFAGDSSIILDEFVVNANKPITSREKVIDAYQGTLVKSANREQLKDIGKAIKTYSSVLDFIRILSPSYRNQTEMYLSEKSYVRYLYAINGVSTTHSNLSIEDVDVQYVESIDIIRLYGPPSNAKAFQEFRWEDFDFGSYAYYLISVQVNTSGSEKFALKGYNKSYEFYNMNYSNKEFNEKIKADYRKTLYWENQVALNSDYKHFYSNDNLSDIAVNAQGITKAGKLFSLYDTIRPLIQEVKFTVIDTSEKYEVVKEDELDLALIKRLTVYDKKTGEKLSNVVLKGLPYNFKTLSNNEGQLGIPDFDMHNKDTLSFSLPGYKTFYITADKDLPEKILLEKENVLPFKKSKNFSAEKLLEKSFEISRKMRKNEVVKVAYFRQTSGRNNLVYSFNEYQMVYKYENPYSITDNIGIVKGREMQTINEKEVLGYKAATTTVDNPLYSDPLVNIPEFLVASAMKNFEYEVSGKTFYKDREAIVLNFKMKKDATEPLFDGYIFIDTKTLAIVNVKYWLSNTGIRYFDPLLYLGREYSIDSKPEEIVYEASYDIYGENLGLDYCKENMLFTKGISKIWFNNVFVANTSINDSKVNLIHNTLSDLNKSTYLVKNPSYNIGFWNIPLLLPEYDLLQQSQYLNGINIYMKK